MTSARTSRIRRALRWLFEDRRTGEIVIGQRPNITLSLFLAAFGADLIVKPRGTADTALRTIAFGSLMVWAADELIRGVNPFRRIGGGVVLLVLLGKALKR